MKQVLQNLKTGKMEIEEVPCPNVGRGKVLIQTSRSLISAGTEKMLIEFSEGNLLEKARSQPDKVRQALDKMKTDGVMPTLEAVFRKLDEPLPLGYCNVGRVAAVGEGVVDLRAGDRVISNGPHAGFVSVPVNLTAKVPADVDDETASFTVLGAIGLQGIRLAEPTLGERFLVFGAGMLGLMTVQMLRANGCSVMVADINEKRLKLAESFGAATFDVSKGDDPVPAAYAWTDGVGVDGVIICASSKTDEIVHQSAAACRKRGRIVLVGVAGLNLRREDFYKKELTFQVSCSYGPGRYDEDYEQGGQDYPAGYVRWTEGRNFEAVLGMMAEGSLDVNSLITHRFSIDDALNAYGKVRNDPAALGVVLEYPEEAALSQCVSLKKTEDADITVKKVHGAVVGVIGAGSFASGTMLPVLAKTGSRLKYLAGSSNTGGLVHLARKFKAEQAVTDSRLILEDEEINTVFILTRHNTHASLVIEALKAGKHVFVEKPLCINENELLKIQEMYQGMEGAPLLMVGLNRRFSLHTLRIKSLLAQRSEPLCMSITVNAGSIPPEHWTQNPGVGGGRIIGEGCHFIDMLSFLAGAPVVTISAIMAGGGCAVREDKMAIQMGFADGSIGTVNYFANGARRYPKEVLEVFSEGRVLRMDNFRRTVGFGFKKFRKFKTRTQDKGYASEVSRFIECVEKGGSAPIPFAGLVNSTMASFAAVKAAKEGNTISLSCFQKEAG